MARERTAPSRSSSSPTSSSNRRFAEVPRELPWISATQSQGACAAFVDLFADAFEVTDPHDTPAVTSKSALEHACESSNATFSEVDLRATAVYPLFSGDGATSPGTAAP